MTRLVRLTGFTVKNGKIVKCARRLDVSARLRERESKKVTVKRKGSA